MFGNLPYNAWVWLPSRFVSWAARSAVWSTRSEPPGDRRSSPIAAPRSPSCCRSTRSSWRTMCSPTRPSTSPRCAPPTRRSSGRARHCARRRHRRVRGRARPPRRRELRSRGEGRGRTRPSGAARSTQAPPRRPPHSPARNGRRAYPRAAASQRKRSRTEGTSALATTEGRRAAHLVASGRQWRAQARGACYSPPPGAGGTHARRLSRSSRTIGSARQSLTFSRSSAPHSSGRCQRPPRLISIVSGRRLDGWDLYGRAIQR